MKITPKQLDMLRTLEKGPKLCGHWEFSGGRAMVVPHALLNAGLIRRCDHPTVKERGATGSFPARAFDLTEAGRDALKSYK